MGDRAARRLDEAHIVVTDAAVDGAALLGLRGFAVLRDVNDQAARRAVEGAQGALDLLAVLARGAQDELVVHPREGAAGFDQRAQRGQYLVDSAVAQGDDFHLLLGMGQPRGEQGEAQQGSEQAFHGAGSVG